MGLFKSIVGVLSPLGGSIIGAQGKAKAAKAAAAAQAAALQQGIDTVKGQEQQNYDLTGNWLEGGKAALGQESQILGLNGPEAQQSIIDQLQASPLYQSLFRTGQNTILANGSATGGLRGGNIQSSLANFGSDTLSKVIQQQLANLGGLSSQGLAAGQGIAGLNTDSATSIASLLNGQGVAKAGGIIGKANANADMYSAVAKTVGQVAGHFI